MAHAQTEEEILYPAAILVGDIIRALEADVVAEHIIEGNSSRVPGTLAHRDELWDQCCRELMANAENRLVQEVTRLGGQFAHVHDEAIDPKHDDAAGEAGLHGRFSYMLYRRPPESMERSLLLSR